MKLNKWDFTDTYLTEPHTFIAGCAGSGKSVLMNDIIFSMSAYHPTNKKIYIIDLKMVEYIQWNIPHIQEVVDDPAKVNTLLDYLIKLMYGRYDDMKRRKLRMTDRCDIYLIIDEMSEVVRIPGATAKIDTIMRLARAAKIHVIGCTQNPSRGRGGIPAEIQKNFSCVLGLRCRSAVESRQIIGITGCESLPRYGMGIQSNADGFQYVNIPLTSDAEIEKRNKAWR